MDNGGILSAEFFEFSKLNFSQKGFRVKKIQNNVYRALHLRYSLCQKFIFKSETNILGEIRGISIDDYLKPSIVYCPFDIRGDSKIFGLPQMLPIETNEDHLWFRFITDIKGKDEITGLTLDLPNRFFLEQYKSKE